MIFVGLSEGNPSCTGCYGRGCDECSIIIIASHAPNGCREIGKYDDIDAAEKAAKQYCTMYDIHDIDRRFNL